MNLKVKQAYNLWASRYDSNNNKTRDLEALALKEMLEAMTFKTVLELGCGTGKNTAWLAAKAATITAVDFSEEMLQKAKEKITLQNVEFHSGDITGNWSFAVEQYDLVTFSLVLEHIEDLSRVFKKAAKALVKGGYLYVGELHPFKQYAGSKARFETEEGLQVVTCYNHHLSDFTTAAKNSGLKVVSIQEYFDNNDRNAVPRILAMLFVKD
jgi:ubiquinone/menaquinone biosynthesis C-methylase UbiE